jgi:hypothetical protein
MKKSLLIILSFLILPLTIYSDGWFFASYVPSCTTPTLSSVTVDANGTSADFTFSESVTWNDTGMTLYDTTQSLTLTVTNPNTTATTFSAKAFTGGTVHCGDTFTVSYTKAGSGIYSGSCQLATLSGWNTSATNGSGANVGTQLVGATDGVAGLLTGYTWYTQFTATVSGTMIAVHPYAGTSNNHIRIAVYSDNAGSPGTLLNQIGSTTTQAGLNSLCFPATSITATTGIYWFAEQVDAAGAGDYYGANGTMKYKAEAYGTAFASNPTGLSSASYHGNIYGSN